MHQYHPHFLDLLMPIVETFASRKRKLARQGSPEVYQYDELPETLRTQLRHVLSSAIGGYKDSEDYSFDRTPNNNDAWNLLAKILRKEFGVDRLSHRAAHAKAEILAHFQTADTDAALSVLEICTRYIDALQNKQSYELQGLGITQDASDAIQEINYRLRDAGVGYEYSNREIMRIDSQLLHAEVVKPALIFLSDPRFAGAEEEFLDAHRHYRNGDLREAVTGANRAFESTMKAICVIKGWNFDEKARASDLIKTLKQNKLFPEYLDKSFDQLLATLSSGLPEVRNNEGGHGQGAKPRPTPLFVAAYALHLAATNIVFLVNATLNRA